MLVDDEDFERIKKHTWHRDNGYIKTNMNGKNTKLHRFILDITDSQILIDHIDRNPLNNQKSNLRICDRSENVINAGLCTSNKSGFKGVSYDKTREIWLATICVNSKKIYLGRYKIKETAARAYDRAAIKYFGEFAYLNFPVE